MYITCITFNRTVWASYMRNLDLPERSLTQHFACRFISIYVNISDIMVIGNLQQGRF